MQQLQQQLAASSGRTPVRAPASYGAPGGNVSTTGFAQPAAGTPNYGGATGYFPTQQKPFVSPVDAGGGVLPTDPTGQFTGLSGPEIFAKVGAQAAPSTPGVKPGGVADTDPTTGLPYATPLSSQLADTARSIARGVAGNPFISAEGKARLARGLLPDMNMIQPGFWQYTQPDIQQALTGLLQSGGTRPEEQQFMQQIWTPGGLR